MRTTFRPVKVLLGEIWRNILARQRDARERKRIEHADKIRHTLTVLNALRSWKFEDGKSQA